MQRCIYNLQQPQKAGKCKGTMEWGQRGERQDADDMKMEMGKIRRGNLTEGGGEEVSMERDRGRMDK